MLNVVFGEGFGKMPDYEDVFTNFILNLTQGKTERVSCKGHVEDSLQDSTKEN